MAFTQTFVGKVLLYVDIFACSVVSRDPGVTISSHCEVALATKQPGLAQAILRALGRTLNRIDREHTAESLSGDTARATETLARLRSMREEVQRARSE